MRTTKQKKHAALTEKIFSIEMLTPPTYFCLIARTSYKGHDLASPRNQVTRKRARLVSQLLIPDDGW